jgi:hypothetical protein
MKRGLAKNLIKLSSNLSRSGFYKESNIVKFIMKRAQSGNDDGAELHVYDFDGTLFRSPSEPAVWSGNWWSSVDSLTPPCVPLEPKDDWWIASSVASAKRSIENPNVFAIMMTGRKDNTGFRYRIPELLDQAGLKFDAVHLNEGGDTLRGKISNIKKYLSIYPFIKSIKIWDDRKSHINSFRKELRSMGYEVKTTHVSELAKEPLCEDDVFESNLPKKISYIGIFLDSKSKNDIIKRFPIAHNKIQNDHITLGFKLTPEFERMIGSSVELEVIGYAEDDLVQAAVVDLGPEIPFEKRGVPHITISHDESVKPKESNSLLERGFEPTDPFIISGIIDTFPRSLRRK